MVRNEISSGALVCREKDGGIEFLLEEEISEYAV